MLSKYLLVDWFGCHPAQVPGMYAMLMGERKGSGMVSDSPGKKWDGILPFPLKGPAMEAAAGGAQGSQGTYRPPLVWRCAVGLGSWYC